MLGEPIPPRVGYRNADDGQMLYDADFVFIPRVGDLVTFPSGRRFRVTDRPPEHLIRERPPHYVTVFVRPVV